MRNYILTILLFASTIAVYPSSDVSFYAINDIYGISLRETFSICKDENDFIWTAARRGILRISGEDYRFYEYPRQTADFVFAKLSYNNPVLLSYTNNGQIFLYDELHDQFVFLLDLRHHLDNKLLEVKAIVVDEKGVLWIASTMGLYKYEKNILVKILDGTHRYDYIAYYDDTHLFCASSDELSLLNIETEQNEIIFTNLSDSNIVVTAFTYDQDLKRLWIGTYSNGLYYFEIDKAQLYPASIKGFPRQPILSIKKDTDSSLYIGIDGQGLWHIDRRGESVLNIYKEEENNPSSLQGDGVYDSYSDEYRTWITTFSGGLSYFVKNNPMISQISHQNNNPNSLGNKHVNKILEDRNGDLWFATNNGISKKKTLSNEWEHYYQNRQEQAKVFLALCEDNQGDIWAGSYASGIYVLDGKTGKEKKHYSTQVGDREFAGNFIIDLFKDSDGDIWIGGNQNLFCYLNKEKRFKSYPIQPVNSFLELAPGKLLLTMPYGMLFFDKQLGKFDVLLDEYLVQDLLAIGEDVWIATGGSGLIRYNFNNQKLETFNVNSGLLSNYVNSIVQVNNTIWIGTENGLNKLSLKDNKITSYPSINSFSNINFNVNAAVNLRNGSTILGTNKGAIILYSENITEPIAKGQLFFQDLSVSGRSIRKNAKLLNHKPINKHTDILLNYDQNNFSLELLPIGMEIKDAKFSWKLEGFDTEWSLPSALHYITYTNLPSGDFELKMQMLDSSLSQIINERSLKIHVIPPYWETWWFKVLLFVILTGVVFYFLKVYIDYLKQRHARDKIRFFTNMAHDIRTSLTLISAPIEQVTQDPYISGKSRAYLNLAAEQSGRLASVATQLLDFEKVDLGKGQLFLTMTDVVKLINQRRLMFEGLAKKKDIDLVFTSNQESFMTAVDEIKIEKIVDNLISNAIKYSHQNGKVEIILLCNNKKWSLEVKDYGLGISDKAKNKLFKEFYRGDNTANSKIVGSGIGLLLVKNYVKMHDGNISLVSKVNQGSAFKIEIPYKEMNQTLFFEEQKKSEIIPQTDFNPLFNSDAETADIKAIHILFVEDNEDLKNFLNMSFQEQYTISLAHDGVEAWEQIQNEIPDIIISDVMMPNMDGFELCKLVKSTFETSHIPLILLTSLSSKTNELEGLGLGADDYITKPFDLSVLRQRINTILKNRTTVREKIMWQIKQRDTGYKILPNSLNDEFVKKALEVVEKNIDNSDFNKEQFASDMYVSSSLLYKKLKSLTDQSPTDFIKEVRLNRAVELLQSGQYTVTEVSEQCGFTSISYFSRVFKKHTGKLPTEILN